MTTIKSFTSLEQSRKLAEILPLESADMHYNNASIKGINYVDEYRAELMDYNTAQKVLFKYLANPMFEIIPCWSLAALLDVIPWGQVNRMTNSNKWEASSWKNSNLVPKYYVEGFDNPTDTCYELILKLHKLKLL